MEDEIIVLGIDLEKILVCDVCNVKLTDPYTDKSVTCNKNSQCLNTKCAIKNDAVDNIIKYGLKKKYLCCPISKTFMNFAMTSVKSRVLDKRSVDIDIYYRYPNTIINRILEILSPERDISEDDCIKIIENISSFSCLNFCTKFTKNIAKYLQSVNHIDIIIGKYVDKHMSKTEYILTYCNYDLIFAYIKTRGIEILFSTDYHNKINFNYVLKNINMKNKIVDFYLNIVNNFTAQLNQAIANGVLLEILQESINEKNDELSIFILESHRNYVFNSALTKNILDILVSKNQFIVLEKFIEIVPESKKMLVCKMQKLPENIIDVLMDDLNDTNAFTHQILYCDYVIIIARRDLSEKIKYKITKNFFAGHKKSLENEIEYFYEISYSPLIVGYMGSDIIDLIGDECITCPDLFVNYVKNKNFDEIKYMMEKINDFTKGKYFSHEILNNQCLTCLEKNKLLKLMIAKNFDLANIL